MPDKKKTSPILKAYIFSILAFLIPSWTASALMNEDLFPGNPDASFITILVIFGLTCWSPSVGLCMIKKWKYGLLAGLGRLLIIMGCALSDKQMLDQMPEGQGHAYLTALGVMAAMTWGIVDFVLIFVWGQKHVEKSKTS